MYQRKYVLDLRKEIRTLGNRATSTLVDSNHKIREKSDDEAINKRRYQRLVGKLIYLVNMRPNITYIVSTISQFMQEPKDKHMQVV